MQKIIIVVAALALLIGGCEVSCTFQSSPEATPTPDLRYYHTTPVIPHQNPKWGNEVDPHQQSMISKDGIPSYEFPHKR